MTAKSLFAVLSAAAIAAAAWAGAAAPPGARAAQAPEPERIAAPNACYVRLPDLPAARYGGFGAYNPQTGVMAFAGGAQALTLDSSLADHALHALKLDGSATRWTNVPYNGSVGYTRETNKGCREMATLQAAAGVWASVLGADGCDNGKVDPVNRTGGDVRILTLGDTADAAGVKWTHDGLNVGSVPIDLAEKAGRLVRHWAVMDGPRGRALFGHGTFDILSASESQEKVWSGTPSGISWNVRELRPTGARPSRRYGACAAAVYDRDAGVDGVLVVGGQPGGVGRAGLAEVHWLDLAAGPNGVWSDITARFGNMAEMGYRYDGACAYDPGTKRFYAWMGRVDPAVAGVAESGGVWRVDLSALADAGAPLTWENLAPDKLDGFAGRSLIPGVYDWTHQRLFVLGGRAGNDEFADAWAVYPDVTGDACATLDPYAPLRPTPEPTSSAPTPEPGGGAEPVVCASTSRLAPAAAIASALANPDSVHGWGERCVPGRPAGPFNPLRRALGVRNAAQPYHPLFNALIWRCGCQ